MNEHVVGAGCELLNSFDPMSLKGARFRIVKEVN